MAMKASPPFVTWKMVDGLLLERLAVVQELFTNGGSWKMSTQNSLSHLMRIQETSCLGLLPARAYFACLDARRLPVRYSSEIMLSSSETPLGIGAKWIQWELPMGREYSTWWNYGVGPARVKAADTHQVTVTAWNGKTQVTKKSMCVCLF